MKINHSNGGSGRGITTDSYRALGEIPRINNSPQFPPVINPFRIPLSSNFDGYGFKYRRKNYNNKSINEMLNTAIGDVLFLRQSLSEVEFLITKCKELCPKGGFKVLEQSITGVKIICTSV